MRAAFSWITLLAFSLTAGCAQESKAPPRQARVFPVVAAKVEKRDVPIYIYAVGNVKASSEATIKPQVSGKLIEVNMVDGQKVKKGQLLFTIDPKPFEAALYKAKANVDKDQAALDLAEATLKRYGQLVKEDYVSKLNYDTYKTNVETLRAQLETDKADVMTAQINLDYCSITAPFDGKASEPFIDEGNIITAEQSELTTVFQIDPVEVRFGISQKDYILFRSTVPKPKKVLVSLPSEAEIEYEGKIFFVDNNISTTTGTILVKARVSNPDEKLWPGEFVKVKLQLQKIKDAFIMPLGALQYGQNGPFVYIIKDDMTVEALPIELLTKNESYVATSKGFAEGESVVIDGQVNLRPGAPVKIKEDVKKP